MKWHLIEQLKLHSSEIKSNVGYWSKSRFYFTIAFLFPQRSISMLIIRDQSEKRPRFTRETLVSLLRPASNPPLAFSSPRPFSFPRTLLVLFILAATPFPLPSQASSCCSFTAGTRKDRSNRSVGASPKLPVSQGISGVSCRGSRSLSFLTSLVSFSQRIARSTKVIARLPAGAWATTQFRRVMSLDVARRV